MPYGKIGNRKSQVANPIGSRACFVPGPCVSASAILSASQAKDQIAPAIVCIAVIGYVIIMAARYAGGTRYFYLEES